MSTLNIPNTFAATDAVDYTKVNENFQAIATAFNGGIDSENLSDGSVSAVKLASSSVDDAKIASDADIDGSKLLNDSISIDKLISIALTNAKVTGILSEAKGGSGSASFSDAVEAVLGTFLDDVIKFNTGATNTGSYATVNGVTSTGAVVEYYTGYVTYFFMTGGYNSSINNASFTFGISATTGLCQSSSSGAGSINWLAVSFNKSVFGL